MFSGLCAFSIRLGCLPQADLTIDLAHARGGRLGGYCLPSVLVLATHGWVLEYLQKYFFPYSL